jgi:hypothetical protein
VLAEERRRADQRAADAALERDLAAAHGVEHHGGRVRAVLDRQAQLEVHRHPAEQLAFHAQEAQLVVVEPRDVVARADVDVVLAERLGEARLHGVGLRFLLRASRPRSSMFMKSVLPPVLSW